MRKRGEDQYGLKPYIYYSCRYKKGNSDFVVNYTLDNTITIYGTVNDSYVTKSGALISPNLVKVDEEKDIKEVSWTDNVGNVKTKKIVTKVTYDETVQIGLETLKEQLILEDDRQKDGSFNAVEYEYIVYGNKKVYRDPNQDKYFWNNKNTKQWITDLETLAVAKVLTTDGHLQSNSAAQYYADAKAFSDWVYENLKEIEQDDAIDASGKKITDFAVNTGNQGIFELNNDNNPLLESSTFNQNRISVIRKSIESNLLTAIANFGSEANYEFTMPKFTEEDWDKLVNNISVATFMQGIPIGTKYFNHYSIITNDKNKEVVTTDSIYIIEDVKNDGHNCNQQDTAHLPTCSKIDDNKVISAYRNIEFERQTAEFSGSEVYYYPQANLRCYDCLVNTKATYRIDDIIEGKLKKYDNSTDTYVEDNKKDISNLRKVYLRALAREKYDLYKTNAYFGV